MAARASSEPLVLRSPEQFKALGHPVRHRLVNLLRQRSATLRQLGDTLGLAKGTVAHHLGVLQDAGMVHVVETRRVRGGTEQYLGLVHETFAFEDGALGADFLYRSALAEILPERPGGPEKTTLRHLWLTADQARDLLRTLERAAALEGSGRPPVRSGARGAAADEVDDGRDDNHTNSRADRGTDPSAEGAGDPGTDPGGAGETGAYGLLISLYRADIPLLPPDVALIG
jgi:DNA-binding transcriptional ArsR family regulator